MKPRFLLDEHINRAIQRQLRRLDVRIDVLAIGDSGTPDAGTPDIVHCSSLCEQSLSTPPSPASSSSPKYWGEAMEGC
jgi:hypothetical protein